MPVTYTYEQLKGMTCLEYVGYYNCVFHGCMYSCALHEAKVAAIQREKNLSKEDAQKFLKDNSGNYSY